MTDTLNKIFDDFSDRFSGQFHSMLWLIMINNRYKGQVVCFVSNYNQNGLQLGVAVANEPGYYPTGVYFVKGTTYDEAQDIIDVLNKLIFELDDATAFKIVLSSMRKL